MANCHLRFESAGSWSDPDSDPVSFNGVDSTSVNGVSVTTDGTNIYYAGPISSDDSFNYTITDGRLTASGTVYLNVSTASLGWAMMPTDTNYLMSLNGNWDFYYEKLSSYYTGSAPNVFLVDSSQNFQSTNYVEGAGWTNIAVPSNWEMDGLSPCTYYGPDSTSGLYRYWINVPSSWQGREVFLNFDGVQTSAEVWLNGQPVDVNEATWGISNYHESGWTAFQVNLTPLVKFGTTNLLAVRVIKKMPAVDLDTGDYFTLGGIFRSVTMYAVPYTNFADVQITTHVFSTNLAEVDVVADVNNGDASTPVSLTLNNVTTTINATNGQLKFTNIINQPLLWSAEFPNLYPYTLQLKDSHGTVAETVSKRLGIREIGITNAILYLNGVPIKMAGVCNHDSWAQTGNTLSSNQWRQDILLMKSANVNAIRTTHYTFGDQFFDLCDELGMYVADELPYCWSDNETGNLNYQSAYLQRAREVLRRDRNHPSVMIWAIGNENNTGSTTPLTNLQAVANLIQATDASRPRLVSCFPASQYNVELGDRHYPSTNTMGNDARAATVHPYIYMEQPNTTDVRLAADTSMWERWGITIGRVWSIITQYDTLVGTFPFEWSDRAVQDPNPDSSYSANGVQLLYYYPNTGIHLLKCKGMVDGFRNPRPEVYEAKMVYSPVQFTNNNLTVSAPSGTLSFPITNRYSFTDLSYLTMAWQLQSRGIQIASGTTNISVPPRSNGVVQIQVPTSQLAQADVFQVDFLHPNGNDVNTARFILTNVVTTALSSNLPPNLPIPQLNLIVRQTVSDPGYWQKVNRFPSTLVNVTITPAGATNLSQLQSMSANIIGGTANTQVGTFTAGYTNNQFSYTINWTGANSIIQELGWTFQMPAGYTNFSWDRNARWSYYASTSPARGTGTANPSSMNADVTGLFNPNSFDFNSTKYDCNWASLTTSTNTGLRVAFSPSQRFHCRGGTNSSGTILYVNQQVSLSDDYTSQIVPDLVMTLTSGNVMSGGFTVGSMSNLLTGATVSLANLVQNYDGTPKSVSVTTSPAGLSTWVTYNGSTNPPTAPGAYTVGATVTDPNYQGGVTNTLVVSLGGLRLLNTTPNADSSMTFSWNAISGNSYALTYKNALTDPQWLTLATGLTPSSGKITVSDPATNSQRFYRIESAAGIGDIAGYIRLGFLGDSDNFASFPFVRPGAIFAQVGSVSSNVITVSGFPDWSVNQFVYASGTQTNNYYIRMTSGAAEGRVWPITANSANSLTVDISSGNLSALSAGDIISIEANWSFATGFNNGAAVNVSPTSGTRNTELLIPDFTTPGINLSAAKIYYYNSGIWKIVGQGTANHSDDSLAPYTHFIVRHNVSTNTQWLVYGTAIQNKIAIPLRTQASTSQDNFIGLMRPTILSLNDSGLISSGAFTTSPLPGSRTDELQVYDNSIIGKNKSASAIYYYWNNAWRSVSAGSSDVGNDPVFQPGLGVILRKATNNSSPAWINSPNW